MSATSWTRPRAEAGHPTGSTGWPSRRRPRSRDRSNRWAEVSSAHRRPPAVARRCLPHPSNLHDRDCPSESGPARVPLFVCSVNGHRGERRAGPSGPLRRVEKAPPRPPEGQNDPGRGARPLRSTLKDRCKDAPHEPLVRAHARPDRASQGPVAPGLDLDVGPGPGGGADPLRRAGPAGPAAPTGMVLTVNGSESREIATKKKIKTIAVSNPAVAQAVARTPTTVQVVGQSPGITTVTLTDVDDGVDRFDVVVVQ